MLGRTSSDKQSSNISATAKKLRNTLSGSFLAKLGSRGKDSCQTDGDYTITAILRADADAQSPLEPAIPGQKFYAQLVESAHLAEPALGSAGASRIGPAVFNPDARAIDASVQAKAASTPAHQHLRSAAFHPEALSNRKDSPSCTEKLLKHVEHTSEERANTLGGSRFLKSEDVDHSRKILLRGISYADEALDSMTALLSLNKGDEDVAASLSKQHELGRAASENTSTLTLDERATGAELSAACYAADPLSTLTSEMDPAAKDRKPTTFLEQKSLPGSFWLSHHTPPIERAASCAAEEHWSNISHQEDTSVGRGESYTDEVILSLMSAVDDASDGVQQEPAEALQSFKQEDSSNDLDKCSLSNSNGQPPKSQNDPTIHTSTHCSTRARGDQTGGQNSQAQALPVDLPVLLNPGVMIKQKPGRIKRGESYADELIAMLSSETSPDQAGSQEDRAQLLPLSSTCMQSPDSARHVVTGSQHAGGSSSEASDGVAQPQDDALMIDPAHNPSAQPFRLPPSGSPLIQPLAKGLRRGESYADEALDNMLAEHDDSGVDEARMRLNWAGLPTIIEGEQVSLTERNKTPMPDPWPDTGRPLSRYGSAEPQHDTLEPIAAETTSAVSDLEEKAQSPELASNPLSLLPQTIRASQSLVQEAATDPYRCAAADELPKGMGQDPAHKLSEASRVRSMAKFMPDKSPGITSGYAEVLSLSKDGGEPGETCYCGSDLRVDVPAADALTQDQQSAATEALSMDSVQGGAKDANLDDATLAAEALVHSPGRQGIGQTSYIGASKVQKLLELGASMKPTSNQAECQQSQRAILPGIADAADQQVRTLNAQLSKSLSATGKASKLLQKTVANVRRTASITRSIPILPSQQSSLQAAGQSLVYTLSSCVPRRTLFLVRDCSSRQHG